MLRVIRDNASSWIVKLILWTIVAAFVGTIFLVWGRGDDLNEKPAATVGKKIITRAMLQQRRNLVLDNIRRQFGDKISDEVLAGLQLEKTALNDMIMEQLQQMAAKQAGLTVSSEEIKDNLADNPNFQVGQHFDKDLYLAILRNNRMSPSDYESRLRQEILIGKLTGLIRDSTQVTEYEIRNEFIKKNEKVKIDYITLTAALYEYNVEVTDKALSEYFDESKSLFKRPETRKIEYIHADPQKLRESIDIPEDEMKSYFESRKEDFSEKEKIRVRHILFSIPPSASEEKKGEIKEKAKQVLNEIKNGADFAEMAKKYSDDAGSANDGGDSGFFERGVMVPEFEREAFALEPGSLSGIVQTNFGFHIIKMEEKQSAMQKQFADVKEQIRQTLLGKKSRLKAKKELSEIARKEGKEKIDWKIAAQKAKLIYKTENLKTGLPVPAVPASLEIVKRVFEMAEMEKIGPLELPDGFYLVRLLEITPEKTPDLKEIRTEVEAAYKQKEGRRMAKKTARKFLKKLREGAEMSGVAKETGLEVNESGYVRRSDGIKVEPSASELILSAFKMESGQYELLEKADKSYIIKLIERKPPDETDFTDKREAIKRELLELRKNDAVAAWKKYIRKNAEDRGIITIETALF